MSPEDIARIAAAFAVANGHSHPEEYAAKVVAAYKESTPQRREDDLGNTLSEARLAREQET
jgi:hypothetical protein